MKTIVGVHENEKITPQTIEISLIAKMHSHEISSNTFKVIIDDFLSKNKPELIEAMAYHLALYIMEYLPSISEISVTVSKPEALPKARAAFATVVISGRIEPGVAEC